MRAARFNENMVIDAAGFVGDVRSRMFNGDNGFVGGHGLAVFEPLGACGCVFVADAADGLETLDFGFGEGEEGGRGWKHLSAEVRVEA